MKRNMIITLYISIILTLVLLTVNIFLLIYFKKNINTDIKLEGGITAMIKSQITNKEASFDNTFFLPYIQLTNQDKKNYSIEDFELEVRYSDTSYRLKRLYSSLFLLKGLFEDTTREIFIPKFTDNLLSNSNGFLGNNGSLNGFLVFIGDKELNLKLAESYKLKIKMTNGNSVELTNYPKDFMHSIRLAELTGLKYQDKLYYIDPKDGLKKEYSFDHIDKIIK